MSKKKAVEKVRSIAKPELISAIAEDAGIRKKEAELALNSFIEVTQSFLEKGHKVKLVGFGSFATRKRKARNGINPSNGKKMKISAKVAPFFKPGLTFKERIARSAK